MTTITQASQNELQQWVVTPGASIDALTASQRPVTGDTTSEEYDGIVHQLQPADGGWAAWRMLISAFVFEALLWGKSSTTSDTSFMLIYCKGFRSLSVYFKSITRVFLSSKAMFILLLLEPSPKVSATLVRLSLQHLSSVFLSTSVTRSTWDGLFVFSDWLQALMPPLLAA